MSTPVHILLVCTANLCRSPVAEHLLRARAEQLGLAATMQISSAGVAASPGSAMDAAAAQELRGRGLDPTAFRTRVLTADLLHTAQLVLVATRDHRVAVAELDPAAVRRTFTLREMGRLAAILAMPPGATVGLHELIEHVRRRRTVRPATGPSEDDVADPFRQGAQAMTDCADLVVAACEPWLARLAHS